MYNEILDSLKHLPSEMQEILKRVTVDMRKQDLEYLDGEIEHLVIDIENRDKIKKILKDFV